MSFKNFQLLLLDQTLNMKGLRNLKSITVMLLGMPTKLAFTDQRHAKLDDFAEQMLKDFMHLFVER